MAFTGIAKYLLGNSCYSSNTKTAGQKFVLMAKKVMKIGVVGFSSPYFDQQYAHQILKEVFINLKQKHSGKEIQIISGYTNIGIPKIAYQLAEEMGFVTVGFTAEQALKVKCGLYPVKEVIIIGKRFGDESEAFVKYIDGLIRVGGGTQSRKEVQLFKALYHEKPLHAILKEYEIDWYGDGALPAVCKINGLSLIPDFINWKEHDALIDYIDNQPWMTELTRRVQHYGYKYNYQARTISSKMKIAPLPIWVDTIKNRILETKLMDHKPEQMIINEYLPGQGISRHIDCEPCFGNTIISVSLGSPTIMEFTNVKSKKRVPVLLPICSAVVLKDEARYKWMHGIPSRKTDRIGRQMQKRSRRISLTFRNIILQ